MKETYTRSVRAEIVMRQVVGRGKAPGAKGRLPQWKVRWHRSKVVRGRYARWEDRGNSETNSSREIDGKGKRG